MPKPPRRRSVSKSPRAPSSSSKPRYAKFDSLPARRALTFEQAEGLEALPTQLKPKELSRALRAAAWKLVLESIEGSSIRGGFGRHVVGPWAEILKDRFVDRLSRPVDEFDSFMPTIVAELKPTILNGTFAEVLGFLQWVIRHPSTRHLPGKFEDEVARVLESNYAAYRVIDSTIMPVASEAERETLERAFVDLASTEFHGARQHLRRAAEHLAAGHHADSIRESIHAVESVVSVLEPKGDFAKALSRLDAKVKIHEAMKIGFTKLYGFTSDEQGIRHPLLEVPAARVDETDALFMIGACAAFVSYLINKARNSGLVD